MIQEFPVFIRQLFLRMGEVRLDPEQRDPRPDLPFNIVHDNRKREGVRREEACLDALGVDDRDRAGPCSHIGRIEEKGMVRSEPAEGAGDTLRDSAGIEYADMR